jgi:hypothetical protein
MKWHNMAELSCSQLQPSSALIVAAVAAFAFADATSAIQSSTPLARLIRNDNHFPSGENAGAAIRTFGGSATFVSTPSAIRLNVIPRIKAGLCGPFVLGLTRTPARRSIGSARSAILGMLVRSSRAITFWAGLTTAIGGGGASRMSTMTLGGSW